MKPIIVAYPRSGSEIVTDIVHNYTKQVWQSERCLQEFLLITFIRDNDFKFVDNKIQGNYWNIPRSEWASQWNKIKDNFHSQLNERISWLKQNPNYVFKLITNPRVSTEAYDWCLNNYHCVFIKRNDRVRSFLSYFFIPYTGLHYSINSEQISKDTKIFFNKDQADTWIWNFKKFNELYTQSDNKSLLVYEDILVNNSVDETKVLETLGWPIPENYQHYEYVTKPTPYEDKDILNYFTNKEVVLEYMAQHSDVFNQTTS